MIYISFALTLSRILNDDYWVSETWARFATSRLQILSMSRIQTLLGQLSKNCFHWQWDGSTCALADATISITFQYLTLYMHYKSNFWFVSRLQLPRWNIEVCSKRVMVITRYDTSIVSNVRRTSCPIDEMAVLEPQPFIHSLTQSLSDQSAH